MSNMCFCYVTSTVAFCILFVGLSFYVITSSLRAVRAEPVRLYTSAAGSLCFLDGGECAELKSGRERDQLSLGCIFLYFVNSLALPGQHNDR